MLRQDENERIEKFFSEINWWRSAYTGQTITYFGRLISGRVEIIKARVRMRAFDDSASVRHEFGEFVVGHHRLAKSHITAEAIKALANGNEVPFSRSLKLVLPRTEGAGIYVPPPTSLHPEGLSTGRRIAVLSMGGGDIQGLFRQPDFDWTLKAMSAPFDGLNELMMAHELGQIGDRASFELIALTPIEVLAVSSIDGEVARLGIWMPRGLTRSRARLGYRVVNRNTVPIRQSVPGRSLKWSKNGDVLHGTIDVTVPRGSVINCVAVYANYAHHSTWVGDPRAIQNPRLSALSVVDSDLKVLRSYLLPTERKGSANKHFESAVSWVLWAYGLSTVHLGDADLAKEGPDVIAVAPNGNMLVVECTLGLLKEESKLAKVVRRSVAIKERLAASGLPTLVLPVLVTSLPRREIESELEAATDAGVVVFSRENLVTALEEILIYPDGDRSFRRAQEALEIAKTSLEAKRQSK